jgi:hypothetical protein
MSEDLTPCLSLAIARLQAVAGDHFARWVTRAPVPGGYVHHDRAWTDELTGLWMAWQETFSLQKSPPLPMSASLTDKAITPPDFFGEGGSYSGQLMQELGMGLWRWLFNEAIGQSLAQSQGIAMGKNHPLRVRLEIRDPYLILLPWEIMQAEIGRQAIALNPQILFSRTTSDVDPLYSRPLGNRLDILLVLGENPSASETNGTGKDVIDSRSLQLEVEAARIVKSTLEERGNRSSFGTSVTIQVDSLIQPSADELIRALDTGKYNAFFYAGHGQPAANGGILCLRPDGQLSGTELAGVLVRNRVMLAVFNACWGAYPARSQPEMMIRSSLAEVLIHHGVPAVIAMRDAIADREALSFIEAFTHALTQRLPIDHAVRIARQQLLTLYKYNQPAWTLPILYMHPEFDGRLLKLDEGITELPTSSNLVLDGEAIPPAYLRCLDGPDRLWRVYGGVMRVGRHEENDCILGEKWVSQRHCEIICRKIDGMGQYQYYLRDFSRFGSFINYEGSWTPIHHRETPLRSGLQIRFGSPLGQILEFVIE